jgi:hypothetical protein
MVRDIAYTYIYIYIFVYVMCDIFYVGKDEMCNHSTSSIPVLSLCRSARSSVSRSGQVKFGHASILSKAARAASGPAFTPEMLESEVPTLSHVCLCCLVIALYL